MWEESLATSHDGNIIASCGPLRSPCHIHRGTAIEECIRRIIWRFFQRGRDFRSIPEVGIDAATIDVYSRGPIPLCVSPFDPKGMQVQCVEFGGSAPVMANSHRDVDITCNFEDSLDNCADDTEEEELD
ncbi:hypothetical protein Ae201684P_020891 [Aphanomyces euteiches]|uniref:Uncharacterized protein n=1 Tax=Aphanomyces euteiches TaxID=100861 RepID=A0A6G0WXD4_9STRA|nr:hypothetical protein Ae201684_010808 [Aphanomyces euteiches]KAH9061556.1 hypothetical protein Ae201684P_020891 [Aphanomyces euteiches]